MYKYVWVCGCVGVWVCRCARECVNVCCKQEGGRMWEPGSVRVLNREREMELGRLERERGGAGQRERERGTGREQNEDNKTHFPRVQTARWRHCSRSKWTFLIEQKSSFQSQFFSILKWWWSHLKPFLQHYSYFLWGSISNYHVLVSNEASFWGNNRSHSGIMQHIQILD